MMDNMTPAVKPVDTPGSGPPAKGSFVVASSLLVPLAGADALEAAFAARLRAVESWPGFQGLQVWRDVATPGHYTMVSWWDDKPSFARYMRSTDHHVSHGRIPAGEHAPKLDTIQRFEIVAT